MIQDRIEKKFKGDKATTKNQFDENNQPLFSSSNATPDQLLIYEVNGKFVRENLLIRPEEINNFKAINMKNQEDLKIRRPRKISYFSGTLGMGL